jgi:hypothetical protein
MSYAPAPQPTAAPQTGSASTLTTILRWSCALLFFARAWQHLRWDAPFRSLLWSQDTMQRPVAWFLGLDWQTYATSPAIADGITGLIKGFGVFYVLCGIAALVCTPKRLWTHLTLILGTVSLVFLAYLSYRNRLYKLGEFGEYTTQFTLPLLLVWWICGTLSRPALLNFFRIGVALTFACHGLYAVGFYPTPGEWVTMTVTLTGLDDSAALLLLHFAGFMDFAVALLILVPLRDLALPALTYAGAWGLATALARSASFVRWENFSDSSAQWLHESIMRLPHATVPLVLFLALRARFAPPRAHPSRPATRSALWPPPPLCPDRQ